MTCCSAEAQLLENRADLRKIFAMARIDMRKKHCNTDKHEPSRKHAGDLGLSWHPLFVSDYNRSLNLCYTFR